MNIDLPVSHVTVMEDRAQVSRRGRVSLPAGRTTVVIPEVAPVLSDRSLRGEIAGRPVADVRVVRRPRVLREDKPEALATTQALIRELQEREARNMDDIERCETEQHLLTKALEQFIADATLDTAWGQPDPEGWSVAMAELDRASVVVRGRDAELQGEQEEIAALLQDARRVEQTLLSPSSELSAEASMTVVLEEAAEVEILVQYMVPGACWRPRHTAEIKGGTLLWATEGCVWQHTGEDWCDATIELSTQRASLGAEPPILREDRLAVQPKREVVVVARDEAIETSGDGVSMTTARGLPGIDDGGEVRALEVRGPATVRSDGRPTFLPLFDFHAEVGVELVAMPEVERGAIYRCRATNGAAGPILAGPVELMRDGGRVGRSTVLFVGSGEQFSLGFGRDPALRIHRREDRTDHPPTAMSRWVRIDRQVVLKLSNLATDARRVALVERVPVSEVPDVEIEVDLAGTTERKAADKDGMVRWRLTLGAGERREVKLAYTVRHRKGVAGL